MSPKIILLTGEPQEGKSSLLEQCLESLGDIRPGGFLAKGLWKNDRREGFDLIDLAKKTRTPLARRNPLAIPGEIPFTFFQKGMDAGTTALNPITCSTADLICVDEVGKLEMKDRGWASLLSPLLELTLPVHLWVVRKNLVHPVSQKWNLDNPAIVSVGQPDARTTLLHLIRK